MKNHQKKWNSYIIITFREQKKARNEEKLLNRFNEHKNYAECGRLKKKMLINSPELGLVRPRIRCTGISSMYTVFEFPFGPNNGDTIVVSIWRLSQLNKQRTEKKGNYIYIGFKTSHVYISTFLSLFCVCFNPTDRIHSSV